jgi:tetratricopeptide (TPR) repeat protein
MASIDQQLDALINNGKFHKAYTLADNYVKGSRGEVSAHIWFKLALAARLIGKDPLHYREAAKNASDYTPIMEGDFLRDQALHAIRAGRLEEATSLISMIEELHQNDPNRLAALTMTRARLSFAHGNPEEALRLHTQAEEEWVKLGNKADRQWVMNNRFHMFKPLVATGQERISDYRLIMASETRRDRKVRVWIMHRFGRFGVMFDRTLERLKS